MYQLRPPPPDLAPFIEHFWFVTCADAPVELRVDVFVDGRADLVFNFGAPYTRHVLGGARQQLTDSNLDAQRLYPIRIEQAGRVRATGVRFHLGGLGALCDVPLRPLTGHTPPPAAVWGDDAVALERSLEATEDLDAQAAQLSAFFRARRTEAAAFARFQAALETLVTSRGAATVGQVAAAAGVSARHVERLFARYLGLAPKTLGRVLRFQTALKMLMAEPAGSLAGVAAEAGYFDQAHFIRDFRQMSGGVPRGYRGYYPPDGPSDFAPNVVVFVQEDAPDVG